jgi:2-methylcitrate dehydratase PrpD
MLVYCELCGIGGIPETAYDVFATCLGTDARPQELSDRLGTIWAIEDGYHKIFACCQYAHSALEASLALHQRVGPDAPQNIERIVVETHPRGLTLTGVEPATVLAAKFSMPHALAAVAVRKTGGKNAFANDTLSDPAIAALRHKVELKPYAPLAPTSTSEPTWKQPCGPHAVDDTTQNPQAGRQASVAALHSAA